MISLDEDALICDLAETYQIYDYRSLPLSTVATLAAGLRDNSRIKMRASGLPVALETLLLASISDRIELFRYGFSKDAEKGNLPPSFVNQLLGEKPAKENKSRAMSFRSVEDFKKAYAQAIGEK